MRGYNIITITLALFATLCSCSVKEDRTPCPCWLSLDLSGCKQISNSFTISAQGLSPLFTESFSITDYPEFFEKEVKKGMVTASVLCGYDNLFEKDGQVLSPEGSDALPVWGYMNSIDCTGEFARDSVILGRQSARIYLKIESVNGKAYPYQLIAKSDVCGLQIKDLSPVKGKYAYTLTLDDESVCTFRLYRQTQDSKATISVLEDGKLIDTLPLYEWINATGYDWDAKDLKDIYIGMDYSKSNVTITVQDWSAEDTIHITI